jgi:hypothetical protein
MLPKLLTIVATHILLLVGFIVGGHTILTGPLFALQTALATVSVWTVLTAIAPILAPLVALALSLVGRIIWNHEKRIRSLERGETRQGRTLYGDEDDPQQDGLANDIKYLSERVDQLEQTIGELRDEIHELNGND